MSVVFFSFFFFNDTATTEIYTLSLHDALPICPMNKGMDDLYAKRKRGEAELEVIHRTDRKSTRLNSSHGSTSDAVFCLTTYAGARARRSGGGTSGGRTIIHLDPKRQ